MLLVTKRDRTSAEASDRSKKDYSLWLLILFLLVWFTPTVRLPGDVPIRLDDILIFGTGALMLAKSLFRLRVQYLDKISWVLIALGAEMVISAFVASQTGSLPVGPKEFLDVTRPIEFLIVYLTVRNSDPEDTLGSIRRGFQIGIIGLVFFALVQFLFMNPSSGGFLAEFFLSFTSLSPEHARGFWGLRPFATFQTPTDFGYVMAVALVVEATLCKRNRWLYAFVAFVGLILSNTRTFLFAAPLLVLVYAVINSNSYKKQIKLVVAGIGIMIGGLIFLYYVAPLVNANFAVNTTRTATDLATGDYSQDGSISIRLQKLELIAYTWNYAPILGVASRKMLGAAADSEYVYTFNRYGLLGILGLIAWYINSWWTVRPLRRDHRNIYTFAVVMLLTTFFYGFTQGALINVRVGIVPIALIGFASSIVFEPARTRESLSYLSDHSAQ